jgi:hypothetical protein
MARKKAAEIKVAVGNISDFSGEVNIAGRDIYKGYTAEQVSALLKQITTTLRPEPFDGRCPYKGLDVFEEEDADLFFGRERLVEDLLGRVKESRTVFITGPSGSGKSSLVRAGLIYALRQGAIKGSNRWLYEIMKPGREPMKDLALAFSRLKGPDLADYFHAHANETNILNKCAESVLSNRKDQRFVLFVDQFEEVFTQINQEEERLTFLNMLAYAGTVENGRVIVLFALRSDFVSNCATYPMINELLSQQFRQIGAMQPEELVNAIALPAKHVGLPIEDELIARIINDMKGEPGALPLMQFALKDLFDSQQEKGGVIALTLEDYLRHGGIHKSLERHADKSFAELNENEQQLARSIFTGLIEIGRGTSDTRRTALFDELIPANAKTEDVGAVVHRLADARLIITDEQAGRDTVTISHEKLIDAWPWLKKLVNENRETITLQNQITEDASEWEEHGKEKSYLYAGTRLTSIQKRLRGFQINNEKAKIFLRASKDAYLRSQLQRGFIACLILLMGVAIYFAVIIPLFADELKMQQVDDLSGAGVNAMQLLPDGTIYAGMYNEKIEGGAPCLAVLAAGTSDWKSFGPTCTSSVVALWVDPGEPGLVYFSQSNEKGLYRSRDGGEYWEKIGTGKDLPIEGIGSLVGTSDGLLFASDLVSAGEVYESADQGNTWSPLRGSPRGRIFTLLWVPQQGLLVGGEGGLWLWNSKGEWQQLIALPATGKVQRILSVTVLPTEIFTILAGGDEGIYLWKEGDPTQSMPKSDVIKQAWSLAVVTQPEPYVIAFTFQNSKIWRMTIDGQNPHQMYEIGSYGFPLIIQNEDPLQLWVGTIDGLYRGELRTRASGLFSVSK